MKALFFANTDWYLYNFRLDYAKFLLSEGWKVVFLCPKGDHFEQFEKEGIHPIPFELSRKGINPLHESKSITEITAIYQKEKPDLVHHFTIKCVIYGSLSAKRIGIKNIVNSITGLGYMFLSPKFYVKLLRQIIKPMYKKALENTEVIFENPDDQTLFNEMGLTDRAKTNVILGTGINTSRFIPVPPPNSTPLVILPARMLWDKGIGEFVQAATQIRQRNIKARFALVGKKDEGNPSSISYDQLTLWQKQGNVEWWGWQEDIIAVISMCDIVCLPSYREGLPKILIEAAACARPIITTDVPGCHEVVKNGVNGLLVPVKDVQKLEDALIMLITDAEMRAKMGIESRNRAVDLFSTEKINAETFTVYKRVLQS